MSTRPGFRAFALALLLLAPSAQAQYMYLDSNGDGVHTAADKLHPVGPTTVDIWLDTAHNRDGSGTSCQVDPTAPFNFFSYVVNLQATNGTVSYSAYTNRVPRMSLLGGVPPASTETDFNTGGWALPILERLPADRYLLGTLTVTVLTGSPSVDIVAHLDTYPDQTLFGSDCPGGDFNNSITLGVDWVDVDGLARPGQRKGAFAPNPLNPSGKLAFTTEREGAARIRVFDAQGRLVRTLLDTSQLNAGPHVITFDGTDGRGSRLSSGIYYYRVDSTAGSFEGHIVVLK
jgi:hypothetical protein